MSMIGQGFSKMNRTKETKIINLTISIHELIQARTLKWMMAEEA